MEACDYCGVKSGADIDKFAACHFTAEKNEKVLAIAPAIQNSPVSLFCKVTKVIELGSHDMFLAEIVSVTVSDQLFESSGKIDLGKAKLVAYSHGEYRSLDQVLGFYGYSVASDAIRARRLPHLAVKGTQRTAKNRTKKK